MNPFEGIKAFGKNEEEFPQEGKRRVCFMIKLVAEQLSMQLFVERILPLSNYYNGQVLT